MYADDTNLTHAGDGGGSIESRLSDDLLNVHTCFNANKLTLRVRSIDRIPE